MTSKTCSICGSTQTTIMDGLMYCATCGTQIFDFREVEADDDGIVCGTAKVRTKKSRELLDKSKASTSGEDLSTSSGRKRRKCTVHITGKKRRFRVLSATPAPASGHYSLKHTS
ncbi:hypothetical protein COOONC_23324, partial [Cooperia oncophora]